jgi:hypothetical protein
VLRSRFLSACILVLVVACAAQEGVSEPAVVAVQVHVTLSPFRSEASPGVARLRSVYTGCYTARLSDEPAWPPDWPREIAFRLLDAPGECFPGSFAVESSLPAPEPPCWDLEFDGSARVYWMPSKGSFPIFYALLRREASGFSAVSEIDSVRIERFAKEPCP